MDLLQRPRIAYLAAGTSISAPPGPTFTRLTSYTGPGPFNGMQIARANLKHTAIRIQRFLAGTFLATGNFIPSCTGLRVCSLFSWRETTYGDKLTTGRVGKQTKTAQYVQRRSGNAIPVRDATNPSKARSVVDALDNITQPETTSSMRTTQSQMPSFLPLDHPAISEYHTSFSDGATRYPRRRTEVHGLGSWRVA